MGELTNLVGTSALLCSGVHRCYGSAQKQVPIWGVEAPGRQGATREHIGEFVTEEQRRPGGMHRQPNATVIMTGATKAHTVQTIDRTAS